MKILFTVVVLLALAAGVFLVMRRHAKSVHNDEQLFTPTDSHSEVSHSSSGRVPAYQNPSETGALEPTLSPANFTGKARAAYVVASEIPETLAQLPCYCHCDQSIGHKSLQSCFVDDHASHCAVCVDEALLAYRLQKEKKMTPEQVREVIIGQYAAAN